MRVSLRRLEKGRYPSTCKGVYFGGSTRRTTKGASEMSHNATPLQVLRDARGNVIPMTPGYCLWCGEYVEVGREEAGSTDPLDPAWQCDGNFGCDASPETSDEGCGDHARPYDLARFFLRTTQQKEG